MCSSRAVRRRVNEIKQQMEQRMEVYKRILEGEDNLWEVKDLGEMKLEVWN